MRMALIIAVVFAVSTAIADEESDLTEAQREIELLELVEKAAKRAEERGDAAVAKTNIGKAAKDELLKCLDMTEGALEKSKQMPPSKALAYLDAVMKHKDACLDMDEERAGMKFPARKKAHLLRQRLYDKFFEDEIDKIVKEFGKTPKDMEIIKKLKKEYAI